MADQGILPGLMRGIAGPVLATVQPQGWTETEAPLGRDAHTITVGPRELQMLATLVESENSRRWGESEYLTGTAGAIDTVFNRMAESGRGMESIINAPRQFSGIHAAGGWENFRAPSSRAIDATIAHLSARHMGAPPVTAGIMFANPEESTASWVRDMIPQFEIGPYGDRHVFGSLPRQQPAPPTNIVIAPELQDQLAQAGFNIPSLATQHMAAVTSTLAERGFAIPGYTVGNVGFNPEALAPVAPDAVLPPGQPVEAPSLRGEGFGPVAAGMSGLGIDTAGVPRADAPMGFASNPPPAPPSTYTQTPLEAPAAPGPAYGPPTAPSDPRIAQGFDLAAPALPSWQDMPSVPGMVPTGYAPEFRQDVGVQQAMLDRYGEEGDAIGPAGRGMAGIEMPGRSIDAARFGDLAAPDMTALPANAPSMVPSYDPTGFQDMVTGPAPAQFDNSRFGTFAPDMSALPSGVPSLVPGGEFMQSPGLFTAPSPPAAAPAPPSGITQTGTPEVRFSDLRFEGGPVDDGLGAALMDRGVGMGPDRAREAMRDMQAPAAPVEARAGGVRIEGYSLPEVGVTPEQAPLVDADRFGQPGPGPRLDAPTISDVVRTMPGYTFNQAPVANGPLNTGMVPAVWGQQFDVPAPVVSALDVRNSPANAFMSQDAIVNDRISTAANQALPSYSDYVAGVQQDMADLAAPAAPPAPTSPAVAAPLSAPDAPTQVAGLPGNTLTDAPAPGAPNSVPAPEGAGRAVVTDITPAAPAPAAPAPMVAPDLTAPDITVHVPNATPAPVVAPAVPSETETEMPAAPSEVPAAPSAAPRITAAPPVTTPAPTTQGPMARPGAAPEAPVAPSLDARSFAPGAAQGLIDKANAAGMAAPPAGQMYGYSPFSSTPVLTPTMGVNATGWDASIPMSGPGVFGALGGGRVDGWGLGGAAIGSLFGGPIGGIVGGLIGKSFGDTMQAPMLDSLPYDPGISPSEGWGGWGWGGADPAGDWGGGGPSGGWGGGFGDAATGGDGNWGTG
jgi:hypothetical protein